MKLMDLLSVTDENINLKIMIGKEMYYAGNAKKINLSAQNNNILSMDVKRQLLHTYLWSCEATLIIEI